MSEVNPNLTAAAPEPFATPELFRDCLTLNELSDFIGAKLLEANYGHLNPDQRPATLGEIIHLSEDEEFYAECAYLNHWNSQLNHDPEEYGIDTAYCALSADGKTIDGVEIYIAYQDEHAVYFQYRLDPDHTDSYELQIIDTDDNIVYWREPGQDPHTEWAINCMADDPEYVNAAGVMAFTGDHTNI